MIIGIQSVVLFAMFSFSTPSISQSAQPRTVLDYYIMLPDKYFEADKEQRVKWMLDRSRGAVVDVKNGYLYAPGDGAQTSIYVCLFRKPDGSYVIAVKSHAPDTDDFTYLDFYAYDAGRLVDVTKTVLPVGENDEFKYEMPRFGRTLRVSNKRGKKIYDLYWIGDRFKLRA